MSRCRACGASVVWARTDAGKPMPLNGDGNGRILEVPDGNVAARPSRVVRAAPVARVLRKGEEPEPDEVRTLAHFATCPFTGGGRR